MRDINETIFELGKLLGRLEKDNSDLSTFIDGFIKDVLPSIRYYNCNIDKFKISARDIKIMAYMQRFSNNSPNEFNKKFNAIKEDMDELISFCKTNIAERFDEPLCDI